MARPDHPPPTRRLVFRTWGDRDTDLAIALWCDPAVTRLITATGIMTRAEALERLRSEIALHREHGLQYWPVFAGARHVGCCGLRPRDPTSGALELGFHLRSAEWGRGYATEAGNAVVRFAFGILGAPALFAGHHPDNAPSGRVLERLGFRYTHDEEYPATGMRHRSYRLDPPPC